MFTRLIIRFAYFLKTSAHYRATKLFFYNLLENSHSRLKPYFDAVMMSLVLLSIFLLIYEVDTQLSDLDILFERIVIVLFIIEYLLRGWLYSDSHPILLEHYERANYLSIRFRWYHALKIIFASKIKYVVTPLAVIDLLAILPSYRSLRVLRILLIFRIFKLFRYLNSVDLFTDVLISKRFELHTLGVSLGFLVFIGGSAIYLFEHVDNGEQVRNLFDAFYFSMMSLSTVGYGDIAPHTTGGRLVAMGLIFSGLTMLSFLISIIVSAFNDKMHDLREHRTYSELNRCQRYVIICGFGRVGEHIAKQLVKHRQRFVIIDSRESSVGRAKKQGYLVIHADASKNDVLTKSGINERATAVLCTTGDDVVNVYITLTSRYLNPNIRIISRANHKENVKKLYQAGASNVIQPFEIAGMVVAEYVGQPVAFEAILGILREEKQFIMETVCIEPHSFFENKPLSDFDFEARKLMLVGVISDNPLNHSHKNSYPVKNQCFYFNPEAHFVLRASDLLVVMGREYSINHLREQIKQSRFKRSWQR